MQLHKLCLFAVAIFMLFVALPAMAQLNTLGNFSQESPAINRSVRALGMGNAFIALPGDRDAPFYNPAGLNDLDKDGKFQFLNPTFEFSENFGSLVGDVTDLIDDLDAANSDAESIAALDAFVTPRFGQFNNVRAALSLVNYTARNFAVGAIVEERITFAFRDQSFPSFDVRNITDVIFYTALAHNFWEKRLQVGLTVKPIVRSSVNERMDSATAINDEVDDTFETLLFPHLGFGFDLGMKSDLKFPFLMKKDFYKRMHRILQPSFAVTWQDIGNTPFKIDLRDPSKAKGEDPVKLAAAASREPVRNEQSVSIGVASRPKIGMFDTAFAIDLRDLNRDGDFMSKFHIGTEVKFPMIVALRLGLSQGYIAGGVGLDLMIFSFDFATYAEEVGIFGRKDGNRMYALRLNFGI